MANAVVITGLPSSLTDLNVGRGVYVKDETRVVGGQHPYANGDGSTLYWCKKSSYYMIGVTGTEVHHDDECYGQACSAKGTIDLAP